MKYLLFSILALGLIIFFACTPKTGVKVVTPAKSSEPTQPVDTETLGSEKPKPTPGIRPAFVSASVQKTPCYGKCPAFEIKFEATGVATYIGKKHVKRLGTWTATIGGKEYTTILEAAQKINYFNLSRTYPEDGKFITDLPFTITSLHFGSDKHKIRNNIDAPEDLISYENFLIELGESLKWTEVTKE